jgi:N utilization substance protein B
VSGDDAERPAAPPSEGSARPRSRAPRGDGRRRAGAISARRKSREFALQGLYEWLIGGADAGVVDAHVREQEGFDQCDAAHFDMLLHGCIRERAELDAMLATHLDRKTEQLSPIEHAVLLIGGYELAHCIEIPYKVVINEAVELAKSFGGTDGHKYVNGVLDKAAAALRGVEVEAARAQRG